MHKRSEALSCYKSDVVFIGFVFCVNKIQYYITHVNVSAITNSHSFNFSLLNRNKFFFLLRCCFKGKYNPHDVITISSIPFKLNYSANIHGYEKQLHLPFTTYQNELRQLLKLTHKRFISGDNKAIFQRLSTSDSTEIIAITVYAQNNACFYL
jgi:hypothetical protein